MSTFHRLVIAGLAVAPLALIAQETGQRERVRQPGRDAATRTEVRTDARPEGHGHAHGRLDHFMVSALRIDNQGEIAISKLAEQKASNAEVKSFAQQMIKEHTDFLAKLDRIDQKGGGAATTGKTEVRTEGRRDANATGSNRPDATNRPDASNRPDATNRPDSTDDNNKDANRDDANKDPNARADAQQPGADRTSRGQNREAGARADVQVDTTRGDVTVGAAGQGMAGGIDQIVRMKKEIGDRCVASTTRELSQKEGNDFDKCFMFIQVGAHQKMVDTLSVYKNHASGELQQVIDEGLQTAQQHLDHAKQLAMKVDQDKDSGSAAGANRSSTGADRKNNADRPGADRPGADRPGADRPGADRPGNTDARIEDNRGKAKSGGTSSGGEANRGSDSPK